MFKRILSMILCITLICLIVMPVNAEETKETKQTQEATRSMEEILNDYHARSAALTTAGANSRSASTDQKDQLKQETIAELNAAGYSAYDVNPTSYNDLEETLQTDFSQMGLDPNGSYIIVISGEEGEEEEEKPANGTRDLILPPHHYDDPQTPGGDFIYEYQGVEYELRYFTITAAEFDFLAEASSCDLVESKTLSVIRNCLNNAICIYADYMTQPFNLGTVASICGLELLDFNFSQTSTLTLNAGTNWTRVYTQVWDEEGESWWYGSCVEYVNFYSYLSGLYYSSVSNRYEQVPQNEKRGTIYSARYDDLAWRKQKAVQGFLGLQNIYDRTGDITYEHNGKVYITHEECYL